MVEAFCQCAKYCQNILISRPVFKSIADLKEIKYAAKTNKTRVCTGISERFNPTILSLKKALLKEEEIYSISIAHFKTLCDGNIINELSVSDIDLAKNIINSEASDFYYTQTNKTNAKSADNVAISFKSKKSHNGWLTFMYPRLMLARDLLSQDGVIFISIDDNEQANLKLLCDEIFGEENFVVGLSTIMNLKGNQDQFGFAGTHEYTLIYAKSKISLKLNGLLVDKEKIQSDWVKDEFGYYKQGAGLVSTGTNSPREHRPSLWYPIFIKDEKIIIPPKEDLNKFYNPNTKEFNDEFLYNYIKEKEKAGVGELKK